MFGRGSRGSNDRQPRQLSLKGHSGLNMNQVNRGADLVRSAIDAGEIPGAVLMVVRSGVVALHTAAGVRAAGSDEPMAADSLFDLASLTKVVATVPVVLSLVEEGYFHLDEPVCHRLTSLDPEKGWDRVTVRQLLTHRSGLPASHAFPDEVGGERQRWLEEINDLLVNEPGSQVCYSDLGFIVLQFFVESVMGKGLDDLARERLFKPLAMADTGFCPPERLRPRIVPTRVGDLELGTVHDLKARLLGGVAGHAGLFSTAIDLGKFCQALLNEGMLGQRILHPQSVRLMTSDQTGGRERYGLGWRLQDGTSAGGSLMGKSAFGHTGFTGCSLWVDPEQDLFVILLAHRVQLGRDAFEPGLARLRRRLHNVMGTAVDPED